MTVLFDRVEDIAGASEQAPLQFWVGDVRENTSGDGIVTTQHHTVYADRGEVTTPDLDPGPAIVQVGIRQYEIVIPESSTPIRLWPLIDAHLPPTPTGPGFLRSDDAARLVVMSTEEFNDLPALDPSTMYATFED